MAKLQSIVSELMKLRTFTTASHELNSWINSAEALTLLVSVVDTGILDALRVSGTVQHVAAATGLDEDRTNNVLNALESYNLVKQRNGIFTISPNLQQFMKDDAIQSLVPVLQAVKVRLKNLQNITGTNEDYTALSDDDVLSMAQGIGISSLSQVRYSMGVMIGHTMPELKKMWQNGCRHLELGCGVGNTLFQILTAFPKVTAVGIEIDTATAAEAQRRVSVLGLNGRVEIRQMNAADLKDAGIYDTAHWSQFFFPESCRPNVLHALFSAMKPGGYVCMPTLASPSKSIWSYRRSMLIMALRSIVSTPSLALAYINGMMISSRANERAEKRIASLQKLIYEMWGVPIKSPSDLKSEVERFGFQVIRSIPVLVSQFSESRGWLLAQRSK